MHAITCDVNYGFRLQNLVFLGTDGRTDARGQQDPKDFSKNSDPSKEKGENVIVCEATPSALIPRVCSCFDSKRTTQRKVRIVVACRVREAAPLSFFLSLSLARSVSLSVSLSLERAHRGKPFTGLLLREKKGETFMFELGRPEMCLPCL